MANVSFSVCAIWYTIFKKLFENMFSNIPKKRMSRLVSSECQLKVIIGTYIESLI